MSYAIQNATRQKIRQYMAKISQLNGIDAPAGDVLTFVAAPEIQQTLETKIQESSAFLSRINVVPVSEQMGEKIGLGIGTTIASTTDTSGAGKRTPSDPTALDNQGYMCTQTNFDTALRYAKIDMWAKFPDFQTRIRDAILQRQALDRIMIGFNGTSRAATSNRAGNPLLQDVNIGWLQKHRVNADARVLDEGAEAGELRIGEAAGGDYKNLDALVMDMKSTLLEPWYQDDTSLVVIVGSSLLHDKYFPLVNKDNENTEKLAADLIISQRRIGGLQAVTAPFVPSDALVITRLDNLSIYWQEGSRRRTFRDNPEKDQYENFESSNEAYVVEDHGCMALAENITLTWAP